MAIESSRKFQSKYIAFGDDNEFCVFANGKKVSISDDRKKSNGNFSGLIEFKVFSVFS